MTKEERQKSKEKLVSTADTAIESISARMKQRQQTFDYENVKDQEKLDELALQKEGLEKLK